MKPMVWYPEEKDQKINEYLDQTNHAPYELIIGLSIGLFCLIAFVFLLASF